MTLALVVVGTAVMCGAGGLLAVRVGLRYLAVEPCRRGSAVALVSGAAAGAAAGLVAHRLNSWPSFSALVLWSISLGAIAGCDVVAQRIPTALVRQATVGVLVLFLLAAAIYDDWWRLARASLVGGSVYAVLWLAWRFSTLGRGDVQIGPIGGIGVGWCGLHGVLAGIIALCLVLLVQASVSLARGGTRRSLIPYAPALVAGFIVAAALS